MTIKAAVFDAYGTLFDVHAAFRALAEEIGLAGRWEAVSEDWRRKQLEYTWLRALMTRHADFRQVTGEALDWTLARHGIDPALHPRLMALYDTCRAYTAVPGLLASLRKTGIATAILSNGSPGRLASAIAAAGIGDVLDHVLSVEDVGVFKPDARVYQMVPDRMGADPAEVLFVSANGWDAAGAAGFGFRTVWINRAGLPLDRLPATPHHTVTDLADILTLPELA